MDILTGDEFDKLRADIKKLPTKEERREARKSLRKMRDLSADLEKKSIIDRLRGNTTDLLAMMQRLDGHYSALASNAGLLDTGALNDISDRLAALGVEFGLPDKAPPAPGEETPMDETELAASADVAPLPPAGPTIERQPVTSSALDYESLADEYLRFFRGMKIRAERLKETERLARTAAGNRARCEDSGGPIGVPWWFIAGIHMMESGFRFTGHLHNGDPLSGRTTHVPEGRPRAKPAAGGRYTWEESARDAMLYKDYDNLSDWSLARALYRWEKYNGFGYRMSGRLVPTPYLWSFSRIYKEGKFGSDSKYDPKLVSKQCGTAVLLRALTDIGAVTDLMVDITEEPPEAKPDADVASAIPPEDNEASDGHPFEAFFNAQINVNGFEGFSWREFLFKGASNETHRNNTDPPQDKYQNVVPLARALCDFRKEYCGGGETIRLLSVYRSPAYNRSVGGAEKSQHKEFRAADFMVHGKGNPVEWRDKLAEMRGRGVFKGKLGLYDTFVHLDTRLSDSRDWDNRG